MPSITAGANKGQGILPGWLSNQAKIGADVVDAARAAGFNVDNIFSQVDGGEWYGAPNVVQNIQNALKPTSQSASPTPTAVSTVTNASIAPSSTPAPPASITSPASSAITPPVAGLQAAMPGPSADSTLSKTADMLLPGSSSVERTALRALRSNSIAPQITQSRILY